MRFYLQALAAIGVLVFGFMLGVRYQTRVESLNEVRTLVQVQKAKIRELRDENGRLHTVVVVREFLERNRIRLTPDTVNHIAGSIHEASARFEIPPEMLLAVIRIESAFDPNALSHKGAVGLMQILPSTAQEIAQELRMEWSGDALLRDPSANIAMGAYYLTKLIGQFDDLAVALAAYNHGPGRIAELAEANAVLPMDYATKVLSHYTPY
ncbi:MAG: lytic transglycosylase domain-containing protein [Candidatus Polarisedimenticolia bacterium]